MTYNSHENKIDIREIPSSEISQTLSTLKLGLKNHIFCTVSNGTYEILFQSVFFSGGGGETCPIFVIPAEKQLSTLFNM